MLQGTSKALVKHKTITYDRPTLYRNGSSYWFDTFKNIIDQMHF